jgi:hypothetical protein
MFSLCSIPSILSSAEFLVAMIITPFSALPEMDLIYSLNERRWQLAQAIFFQRKLYHAAGSSSMGSFILDRLLIPKLKNQF